MFSANQARVTTQSNRDYNYSHEIESEIRHKVRLGEFCCYFDKSKEQQIYAALSGKGYNIQKVSYPHWSNVLEDDPKDHVFIEFIKVQW